MPISVLAKRRIIGAVLLAVIVGADIAFGWLPSLDTVEADPGVGEQICFQGTCFEVEDEAAPTLSWWEVTRTHFELAGLGVLLALLAAGAATLLLPTTPTQPSFASSLKDMLLWPRGRRIASEEPGGPRAMAQRSFSLDVPTLVIAVLIFTPALGVSRIVVGVVATVLLGPFVIRSLGSPNTPLETGSPLNDSLDTEGWAEVFRSTFVDWGRASAGYLGRVGLPMAAVAVLAGLGFGTSVPDAVSTYLGDDALGVGLAATVGLLVSAPLFIEIPLVALLLALGMSPAAGATLLFVIAIGGPVAFREIAKAASRRAVASVAVGTWAVGAAAGLGVLAMGALTETTNVLEGATAAAAPPDSAVEGTNPRPALGPTESGPGRMLAGVLEDEPGMDASEIDEIVPFVDIAATALGDKASLDNPLPGVAIFDYDRDGKLDLYFTQTGGRPNYLFHNEGSDSYRELAEEAGVAAVKSNSTGVAACDVDNDGFQDLYVAAETNRQGPSDWNSPEFLETAADRLYLNNGDGTFREITDSAFGEDINHRRASSVICADVDNDGWIDIFVGNRSDVGGPNRNSFRNVLFRNNGDLTFTNVAPGAGIEGHQQIQVQDEAVRNEPVTWAALFFDYDDDGDPDLWVGNDADRLRVYRNDSSGTRIRFTPVERAMGIDAGGNWMGFAPADYDGDGDIDIFITNIGFHPRTRPAPSQRTGDCAWIQQYEWGTCDHFLLRNDGLRQVPGVGTVGIFRDIAPSTVVEPSRLMPPASLDHLNILPSWQPPTGLAAYDFGFGTVFFDYDNDGDQDLYWLGSLIDRGEAENGMRFPAAGRMLSGDGSGSFQDITVEAHLLDIRNVDYSVLDPADPAFDRKRQRIGVEFHENGKGLAKGDLNNDGYVDLAATNTSGDLVEGDGTRFENGPVFLWMNPGGERHWLTLRLKGRMAIDGKGSNADAIGARVFVRAKVDGNDTRLLVDTVAISSFLSMSSLDLNFGLGRAEQAEEITIFWPSGVRQVMTNVAADQVMEIEEPTE